jgi:hypothetical protein
MPERKVQPPGQQKRGALKFNTLILLDILWWVAYAEEANPAARSKSAGMLLQAALKEKGRMISHPAFISSRPRRLVTPRAAGPA